MLWTKAVVNLPYELWTLILSVVGLLLHWISDVLDALAYGLWKADRSLRGIVAKRRYGA